MRPDQMNNARSVLLVADLLERAGNPGASGILRVTIGDYVAECAGSDLNRRSPVATECPKCGGPIERKRRGAPKLYCSDTCRKAAHRDGKRRPEKLVL